MSTRRIQIKDHKIGKRFHARLTHRPGIALIQDPDPFWQASSRACPKHSDNPLLLLIDVRFGDPKIAACSCQKCWPKPSMAAVGKSGTEE